MRVRVNGREMNVATDTTVALLLAALRLEPRHVAVEVNRELVPRRTFEATRLKEGDEVEIVTLVGGGRSRRPDSSAS
ncbi:MAG: sulfur carrier protein ThiS [Phycisphaerae bacterium]|jgi:thiamine biosynthesis protein ThiS